jgi:hypothetical protein
VSKPYKEPVVIEYVKIGSELAKTFDWFAVGVTVIAWATTVGLREAVEFE